MKKANIITMIGMAVLLVLVVVTPWAWSGVLEPSVSTDMLIKAKAPFDDPRPLYVDLNWKKLTTKEWVEKLSVDVEAAKKAWAEVVGFRAPDVVGKVAPEIKPGIYNYTDKDKYPGLKELMIPYHWEMFGPGGPPYPTKFRQIKIIPTRQYYNPTAYSELSKKNLGKTKQDSQGYIVWQTYEGGIPWPQPSGPQKGMQIMYNQQIVPVCSDDSFVVNLANSFTKDLKMDFEARAWGGQLKTQGRITPPVGWLDARARQYGELRVKGFVFLSPRDNFGMVMGMTEYLDPTKWTNEKIYIPGLRRVRVLSSTDTQDVNPGAADALYDDTMGFYQKMSPKAFPMSYKVVDEREYLVPAMSIEGREYLQSAAKGGERVGWEWERRPMYVVELDELDAGYVYSKRILYIDRETFEIYVSLQYDRKGRLYRTFENMSQFIPDAGIINCGTVQIMLDHIDRHSTVNQTLVYPDPSRMRRDLGNIEALKLTK